MGHLTKWVYFNLLFGAIPYGFVVALTQLQSPGAPVLHPSVEVLFIAIVATSSALGELWDADHHAWIRPVSPWKGRWKLFLLTGVLVTSLLYGAYVYHTLQSPGRVAGIDCGVISGVSSPAGEPASRVLVRPWMQACNHWAQVQARFYAVSLWMTGFFALASSVAVYLYPSHGGRSHGMV